MIGGGPFASSDSTAEEAAGGVNGENAMMAKGLSVADFCDAGGEVIRKRAGGALHFEVEIGEAGAEVLVGG